MQHKKAFLIKEKKWGHIHSSSLKVNQWEEETWAYQSITPWMSEGMDPLKMKAILNKNQAATVTQEHSEERTGQFAYFLILVTTSN